MSALTQWIQTPGNWKDLKPHTLCQLAEFGTGIDIVAMSDHMRRIGYDDDESIILIREEKKLWILDGKHRHVAAQNADVVPTFRLYTGGDALSYVMKKLHRQHYTPSQIAMYAAKYATAQRGRPEKTCLSGTFSSETAEIPQTNAQVAEKFGISERAVDRGKTVLANGTPALQEAARNGTVTVTDAAKIASEPPKVQNQAVKDVKKGKARTATKAVKEREPGDESENDGKKKSGKVLFDFEKVTAPLGKLIRSFEECAKVYGKSEHYKEMDKLMAQVTDGWKEWRKDLQKVK